MQNDSDIAVLLNPNAGQVSPEPADPDRQRLRLGQMNGQVERLRPCRDLRGVSDDRRSIVAVVGSAGPNMRIPGTQY